jgi:acetyl-CoA carboxylase carboxyl transferase subunit beta
LDKIFKRTTAKEHNEQSQPPLEGADKPADSATDKEIDAEKAGLLTGAEGPRPKFGWHIKPQAHGENAKAAEKGKSKEIPDGLYVKCTGCKELIYSKELEKNDKICHKCGQHFRMTARERIQFVLDEHSFEEINGRLVTSDPLKFTSLAEPSYKLKAAQARKKSQVNEAIVTGLGTLENLPLGIAVCDFNYQGGSMGSVFGEKLTRLIELCVERRLPVLTINASGGARMHEGMFSLMQMAKTTVALAKLGESGLPHFSLLTDPCTGGVTASYATVADIIMAEPGALIGFAGPRVIEQITKQKLPPGFQTAEFVLEHGMIDKVVPRREFRATMATLLRHYKLAEEQSRPAPAHTEVEVSYAR